jgi:tetratricopeptide (TPR) repeat protein
MTPAARLTGGVLVLAVYAWTLAPAPPAAAPGAPGETGSDAGVEAWIALSTKAFAEGHYADALDPTTKLVERFPSQVVYLDRLARIHGKLDRPADEAADWERFVDVSPTPADACPALGNAYARAGQPEKSLDAFRRCVAFDPRNAELQFFLGLACERA